MAPGAVEPESLSYRDARTRVFEAVRALPPETLPLAECRARALRQAVTAPHALPPFRNSSMDGFAVRSADLSDALELPRVLPVGEVIAAGKVASRALRAGEAMRIMTGAMLPDGADAVVPFEECERLDGASERARFRATVAAGQNVREAGADVTAGQPLFEEGRELSAHDLALLASLGLSRLVVGRRPRVIVISTGDELVDLDAPLPPGAIRDSNRLMLAGQMEAAGAIVLRSARVPDDVAKVRAAIESALGAADVVATIGGVSAGDFDPVKQALADIGDIELWRVAMKPGRPQAFGTPHGRLFFGLPGNPASVACTFEAFVRPALRALAGHAKTGRPRFRARVRERIASRAGRVDFVRVRIELADDGPWAVAAGEQISGHLKPQSDANALLVVPAEREALEPGDVAEAWVLRWPEVA